MAKESEYRTQLMELGVYSPAFDPTIHMLCILEREHSRAMKAWKKNAPKGSSPLVTDPLYEQITKLRKTMLDYRNALGLTPTGLQKLRRQATPAQESPPVVNSGNAAFAALLSGIKENTHGGSA